jgi:hypothetical protein
VIFNREKYVAIQLSFPKGGKNQLVYIIFYIKFGSFIIKKKILFSKRRIGLGIRISLLLGLRLQGTTWWPPNHPSQFSVEQVGGH